jgi:hypothetical protein
MSCLAIYSGPAQLLDLGSRSALEVTNSSKNLASMVNSKEVNKICTTQWQSLMVNRPRESAPTIVPSMNAVM